jgi:hypothetical protein
MRLGILKLTLCDGVYLLIIENCLDGTTQYKRLPEALVPQIQRVWDMLSGLPDVPEEMVIHD